MSSFLFNPLDFDCYLFRFLYVLILAMDANFRLTNRMRANEHDDAELGPGWGCFVESAPYKEHLKNYISEADVGAPSSYQISGVLTVVR